MDNDTIIIGLTGPFGSGCTYVAHKFIEQFGYQYLSLSDVLREEFDKQKKSDASIRNNLQEFGDELREKNGSDYLAKCIVEKISKNPTTKKWVVDSIRNTHEIDYLRKLPGKFYLMAIWADKDTRWDRVKDLYKKEMATFEKDDKRDSDEKKENGQQVSLCYQMADIVVLNSKRIYDDSQDYNEFKKIIKKYIDLFEDKEKFVPNEKETLMTMAYANSLRSSCSQRKVGALIIDDSGNVFSSGYNEVPSSERSCKNEYGKCYRKYLRDGFENEIESIIKNQEEKIQVKSSFKKFKILDYCRALHAEENAIVNVARMGISFPMERATLYTTTYPCNLCANKIAQVGIKHIVYFEPYPMEEAKKILEEHKIQQVPFDGITYNGYFKFMEVLR